MLLLQMLCRKGVGWDDPLQECEKLQWKRWLDDLPKLQAVRVNRCFKPAGFGDVKKAQLHLFSDASGLGYSAVAYLRLEDFNDQIYCAFVIGKARLAPLREISIPRLERTAAVISVRLSKIVQEELDLTVQQVYYWTDSMSVLKCIHNENRRFHTFESNRLSVIHSGSVLVERLLRVGGRLVNARVRGKTKHPIIIPFKHPVTDMIIRYHHAAVGHMGQESVLSSLRGEFWIIKGRTAVRRVVRSCVDCQRRKARLGQQLMAYLPESRVTLQHLRLRRLELTFLGFYMWNEDVHWWKDTVVFSHASRRERYI